jgi:hypothetical protein
LPGQTIGTCESRAFGRGATRYCPCLLLLGDTTLAGVFGTSPEGAATESDEIVNIGTKILSCDILVDCQPSRSRGRKKTGAMVRL